MSTAPAKTTDNAPAPQPKPAVVSIVRKKIEGMVSAGQLLFPADYSAENALVAAQLELLKVENRDKKRILDPSGRPTGVVTESSIVNALTQMLVEGMNVTKGQGSFIVYKEELTWQREYPGDIALAKRVNPGIEFYFDTIREGEEIAVERKWSSEAGFVDVVTDHKKPFPRKPTLTGAYCGVFRVASQEPLLLILFDIERIKKSWAMSRNRENNQLQQIFTDIAAQRTVIRRAATQIINQSDDSALLARLRRNGILSAEREIDEDAAEHANAEIIDVTDQLQPAIDEGAKHVDTSTGEVKQPELESAPTPPAAAEEAAPY